MPMAMVVTRNVEDRYRGFLTSVMLEVAPGMYVAPDMSAGVRTRVWGVLTDWWMYLRTGSIVMVWRDVAVGGQSPNRDAWRAAEGDCGRRWGLACEEEVAAPNLRPHSRCSLTMS